MLQLAVTCEMRNGHYTTNIPGSNHGKRLVFWRSLRSTTLEYMCKTVFERDFNPSNRGPFSFQHYATNHSIHLYALNSLKHIFV